MFRGKVRFSDAASALQAARETACQIGVSGLSALDGEVRFVAETQRELDAVRGVVAAVGRLMAARRRLVRVRG